MDFDADKLAKFVALIAYGLAFRQGYSNLVQHRKEEAANNILWAVIWSAPLKIVFEAIGKEPWNPFGIQKYDQLVALSFVYNVAIAWTIGYLLGWLTIVRISLKRHPDNWKNIFGLLNTKPPRLDLIQEWIQDSCTDSWVLVETNDGRAYRGWIHFYDLQQDRAKDMHLVLAEPTRFNLETEELAKTPFAAELLISIKDVRVIRKLDGKPLNTSSAAGSPAPSSVEPPPEQP